MKKKVFSLMMTLVLAFMGMAQAQVSLPYTEGFESGIGSWTLSNCYSSTGVQTSSSYAHTGSASFDFYFSTNPPQYLISPEFTGTGSGLDVEFYYRARGTSYTETFQVGHSTTTNAISAFEFGPVISTNSTSWSTYTNSFPAGTKYVAIKYTANDQWHLYLDDFSFTTSGGGSGTGSMEDQLHVKYMDGDTEVIDSLNLGVRPAGCWMAPFEFTMYSEGPNYTVNVLDFTPSDGMFAVEGEELPFQVAPSADVNLIMSTTDNAQAGVIERQFVAITEGIRAAHIWPVVVELYDPQVPDVVEFPCEEATTFPFVEVPAEDHEVTLHNDYTLPFPEIPEGYDAVYKLVFANDMMLNASVTEGENGKVALYLQEGDELPHPMADNNYNGPIAGAGGGAAGAPFEAQIGEGTNSSFGYFPFYTLYNYSIAENLFLASELEAAGVTTAPMTSLSWYATNTTGYAQQGISIWMANVPDTELTTTSHVVSGMTLVYTGTMTPLVGWNEFVFNEGNFAWDGSSNVLIFCQRNNGAWNSTVYWESTPSMPFNATSYRYQDSGAYDVTVANPMYTSTTRPNIIMKAEGTHGRDVRDGMAYGPVITDAAVAAGTYYLVASSTDENFEVTINADLMPCPEVDGFAFNPIPADDADEIEPASVTLTWSIPDYATGWRLVFGSTYYPEPNHPQTIIYPEDGSFSTELANSYTVRNLWNNTNYFWHVEFNNNGACPEGVSSPIWGFTTHLNVPQNLTVADETVFNDEQVVLSWNPVVDRTYRKYFIYRDGVKIGETPVNNIGATTYTDGPLTYNMDGYNYYVTAVYDEGESAPSNTVNVKVSGYGDVNGHVYEQDSITGIAGATVTMVGQDEFGVSHTYNFLTDGNGYYSGHIYAGAAYDGQAACNGYQTANAPVQGEPIVVNYNETASPYDYILDENFDPVCGVIAEYYPDSLDPQSPYVKVYWGCGLPGSEIIEDFETGDFSMFDWQLDGNYPWSVTTTNPYEGTYCMKSGGAGVANVVSNMTVTVEIPADGEMSFYGKISCESSWDYGYFFIDNVQMGQYTGAGSWGERHFPITAGTHTFQWRYTKDGSVNSNDDCFYVDYINFYKQPEPLGAGWHTYLEGEFNDALRSNLTEQPAFGYHYPTSITSQYNGFQLTKVSMFSDDLYGAVGGNYTAKIYQGGSTPGAGTLVSEKTVDLPVGLGQWVDWDLDTPVTVNGNQDLWVIWQVNVAGGMGYPAGMCNSDSNPNGDWWNAGEGWENYGGGVWTMRNYFTDRSGRSVVLGSNKPVAIVDNNPIQSNLRTYVKGDDRVVSESINPGAPSKPLMMDEGIRSLDHYRVYRTNCYNDGPYTVENTVLLATVWVPDTVYIDVEWADLPAGVYKWGVGAVYSGNRGEEIAGPINWSDPVNVNNATRDAFTYGFEGGLNGWTVIDVNADGGTWVHSDNNPGAYEYGSHAHGGTGFAMCYSFVDYDGAYDTDSYLVSPQKYSIANGSNMTFWADNANDDYPENFSVCIATTAANPTAADFTTIWSGAAKGNGGEKSSFRHVNDRYDNWRSHTIDLSAYAGQEVWIAFHDVNYDAYEVWIDDVTINAGGGGTGPVPPTPGSNELQLPRESEIVWSNCLDKDMYLGENDVNITVLLNSADAPEDVTVNFVNLNEVEQELYPVDDVVLDSTGYYAWDSFRKGDYLLTLTKEGYETITDTVSLWNPESLRYVMIEIIYGVDNLYVSSTGWAMWEGLGPNPTPGPDPTGDNSFECGFENGLEGWTTIDNDGDGLNWVNSVNSASASGYDYTGLAHGGNYFVYSQSFIDYDGAYDADNYLITPQKYSITNSSTLTFWADNANDSYPDHFAVAVSTADTPTASSFTDVWSHSGAKAGDKAAVRNMGGRYENWRSHSVDLSAYAGQNVWIAFHHQDYDMYEIWIDDVVLSAGSKSDDRHLEYFKVMCTSIDGEPIFNANVPADQPFCQVATDELVEGEHYICKVASVYSTGMSAWTECEWQYISCENYNGVAEGPTYDNNVLSWTYPGGGTGPTPPGDGDNFSVDFEGGMPAGWTVNDANNDGYTWCLTSAIPTTWTYYASLDLDWYHGGSNAICSGSYINGVGALNPDEYLISPAVNLANGSQLSFWVAATDASYPADHFGVFVSTTGTNPSDFESVQEWTLTGKKSGLAGGAASRDGRGLRLGTWYNYTVDLSAYAGSARYIAFRHFNCYDQYIMVLDDITLTSGAKNNRDYLQYCTEVCDGGVGTGGGAVYWGIRFPAANLAAYAGQNLTKVGIFTQVDGTYGWTYSGDYTAKVFLGGTTAPGTLVSEVTEHLTGDDSWHDITLSTPVAIDGTQDLWLTFYTPNIAYPMSGCTYVGESNSDFLSLDGVTWEHSTDYALDYTWMIRGLVEGGTGPVPPVDPSGDVLGAMIFADGEWEAFVPAPTNTYEYTGDASELCVRMVYNGTNTLPEGNIFYSMSCPECVEGAPAVTCEPGDPIHIEELGATDQIKIWWGEMPAPPMSEWLYYDNGTYATSVGTNDATATIYWATMFPAELLTPYAGTSLTKVAAFEFASSNTTPKTVTIYLGGTTAPGTAYSTVTYTPSVDGDFEEVTLTTPVAIDGTQNLWIVCSQMGTHPAQACTDTGEANNRWISLNGTTWQDLADAGLPGYGWLLRGFVTNQAKGVENTPIEVVPQGVAVGELTHTEVVSIPAPMAFLNRASIVKYNVYRSDDNANYTLIGEVVEDGSGYYEYIDTPEVGTYYYQVKAVYDNECVSEAAAAFDNPAQNYVVGEVTGMGENSDKVALYPNPTKGNVTIEANGMSRITVVSVLGQVVYDTEVNADNVTLNMSQFNAGMYMVRVYTESGVVVKRVTVMQ